MTKCSFDAEHLQIGQLCARVAQRADACAIRSNVHCRRQAWPYRDTATLELTLAPYLTGIYKSVKVHLTLTEVHKRQNWVMLKFTLPHRSVYECQS